MILLSLAKTPVQHTVERILRYVGKFISNLPSFLGQ